MKKLTTLIFMLLISFCFVLGGCGETPLVMPTDFTSVKSNGGFVVGAGNYVYFANAYKDNTKIENQSENDGEGVAQFSLKRAEVNTSNNWFNFVKDEDKKISYENVINKIAGYQVSNMYVSGEYLYFTSPNIHKNKENQNEFNLSTLFKIKLDGTGLSEIYTTKSSTATFYLAGKQKQQILIFDDEKIKTVKISENSSSVDTLAEDVTTVVFPKLQEQDIAWLYYTSNRAEEDLLTGNILNKVSVDNGDVVENVSAVAGQTITLISQDFGRLFYIKEKGTSKALYSNDFSSASSEVSHGVVASGIVDGGDLMYIPAEDESKSCFVYIYNNALYLQLISGTQASQSVQVTSETATIQFLAGTYVFYSTESGIYKYSILDRVNLQVADMANINDSVMDYDGKFVYFFVKEDSQTTETEYLYRADAHLSGGMKTELVAELAEDDIPEDDEGKVEE